MISNCGHDENKQYRGGNAGDQTGDEWAVIPWYRRPWKCVLRHPDESIRQELARQARAAAKNDYCGYDQGQRLTFWRELEKSNYDAVQIRNKCEADCSSGVAAIVKAAGYRLKKDKLKNVSESAYTGNLRAVLKNAGFGVLTADRYLESDAYLLAGDVLLYDGHHTAINLDDGAMAHSTVKDGANLDCTVKLPSLVKGDRGAYVTTLQRLLAAYGYSTNGIDGIFGSGTELAVKHFQTDKSVRVNYPGTVGAKTWTVLLAG